VGQGNENGWPLYVQDKDKNRCFLGLAVRLAEMYAIFSHLRAFLKYTALSRVHKNVTLMARS